MPHLVYRAKWVWLDDGREITYATSTGFTGEGALWHMDVDSGDNTKILDLNVPEELAFASAQDRIYLGEWRGLHSLEPDGSDYVLEATDIRGDVSVSPSGRFRAQTIDATGARILIDTQDGDTILLGEVGQKLQLEDSGHLIHYIRDGVAILDLSTGSTVEMVSPESVGPIDVRGPVAAPELVGFQTTDAESDARVVMFVGDPSGLGTVSELHRIPRDSIWGVSNIESVRSPDGRLVAHGITRSISCRGGDGCFETYAIEVHDIVTGSRRVVANGVSAEGAWGLVISPDGSRLLYTTDGSLYLVELGSGVPE